MTEYNSPEEFADVHGIGDEYGQLETRLDARAAGSLCFLAMMWTDRGGDRGPSVPDPDAARQILRRHLALSDDQLRALTDGYIVEADAHLERLETHETETLAALDFDAVDEQ